LYISALTIGFSYFIGGLIPLVPYMARSSPTEGLIISCVVTGVVLFIFGAFKTYFTWVPKRHDLSLLTSVWIEAQPVELEAISMER